MRLLLTILMVMAVALVGCAVEEPAPTPTDLDLDLDGVCPILATAIRGGENLGLTYEETLLNIAADQDMSIMSLVVLAERCEDYYAARGL